MLSHTLSTFNSKTVNVPKLHDDRSNWADYHAWVQVAMEAKGLWKHVEGKATLPKPYAKVNGIAVLSDGKTQAMEEQIEACKCRIDDYTKAASLAKHIILSMMSARIGMKIKLLPLWRRCGMRWRKMLLQRAHFTLWMWNTNSKAWGFLSHLTQKLT